MIAGATAALTVVSGWAEHRRLRRRNIEAVGFMPWGLLTVLGVMGTLFAVAFAIKSGGMG